MKFNRVAPALWTIDLAKTSAFYQQTLRFDRINEPKAGRAQEE